MVGIWASEIGIGIGITEMGDTPAYTQWRFWTEHFMVGHVYQAPVWVGGWEGQGVREGGGEISPASTVKGFDMVLRITQKCICHSSFINLHSMDTFVTNAPMS